MSNLSNLTKLLMLPLLLLLIQLPVSETVKCLDCVGAKCMHSFCHGKYCMYSQYAPRWGTVEWGERQVVKGCINGSMLSNNLKDHCEAVDEDGQEIFTCFCSKKDNCNNAVSKLPVQVVPLIRCVCKGGHCTQPTCLGELCSYVVNHRTKEVEQGCVNASIPLMERRTAGACMIPPITGAMHHTVAKDANDLLKTESCICANEFCNAAKPKITVAENQKCGTWVSANVLNMQMESKNVTCTGEFCFRAKIKSKLGHMTSYQTIGCASFVEDYELAEELNPLGCATFESEKLSVETCFSTKDPDAVQRAMEKQEVSQPRRKPSKSKGKGGKKPRPVEDEEEEEEEEAEERRPQKGRKPQKQKEEEEEEEEEPETIEKEFENELEKEAESGGRKTKELTDGDEEPGESARPNAHTPKTHFIFEAATEAPIPEDSNAALIGVFLLVMLLIVMAGVVYKFQLHKRLFRASYDTVAGG